MAAAAGSPASPLAYFLAGMLVPTIGYFFLNRQGGHRGKGTSNVDLGEDDDWDDDSDDGGAPVPTGSNNPSASWGLTDAPYKMVLCVNTSLGMGKGMCQCHDTIYCLWYIIVF